MWLFFTLYIVLAFTKSTVSSGLSMIPASTTAAFFPCSQGWLWHSGASHIHLPSAAVNLICTNVTVREGEKEEGGKGEREERRKQEKGKKKKELWNLKDPMVYHTFSTEPNFLSYMIFSSLLWNALSFPQIILSVHSTCSGIQAPASNSLLLDRALEPCLVLYPSLKWLRFPVGIPRLNEISSTNWDSIQLNNRRNFPYQLPFFCPKFLLRGFLPTPHVHTCLHAQ